ncbi:hypothetical protein COLO4_38140 [Corchorus olitorius]|uniref:Uncharacterized protein n=1 Tax=Corchorus olitorius TaxID=93759 RepID=A0A1R3FWR5_9ROSI|nr:hypothetical protein COLO4_38140 [Corchorus olitorius]
MGNLVLGGFKDFVVGFSERGDKGCSGFGLSTAVSKQCGNGAAREERLAWLKKEEEKGGACSVEGSSFVEWQ